MQSVISDMASTYQTDHMPTPNPWYCNTKFDKFWQSYTAFMYNAHTDAISRCNNIAYDTASTLKKMMPVNVFKSKKKKKHKNRKKPKSKVKESLFILTDDDTLQVSLAEGMQLNDSEDENEIDEEYLAFMEQSLKHRMKWRKKKKQQSITDQKMEEDSNFSQESSNFIQEHPDIIRNRDMKQMYGATASQIHAMETAMQLSFDRISTVNNPSMWPNIPLKLSFI